MTRLTRDEAIKATSEATVRAVLGRNCEPTCRLTDGDGTEWSASVEIPGDEDRGWLYVYYMTTPEDARKAELNADWGSIDWESKIIGYEIC